MAKKARTAFHILLAGSPFRPSGATQIAHADTPRSAGKISTRLTRNHPRLATSTAIPSPCTITTATVGIDQTSRRHLNIGSEGQAARFKVHNPLIKQSTFDRRHCSNAGRSGALIKGIKTSTRRHSAHAHAPLLKGCNAGFSLLGSVATDRTSIPARTPGGTIRFAGSLKNRLWINRRRRFWRRWRRG